MEDTIPKEEVVDDEVSRLEGSPSHSPPRPEKVSDNEEGDSISDTRKSVVKCSLSSLEDNVVCTSESSSTNSVVQEEVVVDEHCDDENTTELGKRSDLPSKPTLPVKQPDENDVGRRVEVFWPEENNWYVGVIDRFRDGRGVIVRQLKVDESESSQENGNAGNDTDPEKEHKVDSENSTSVKTDDVLQPVLPKLESDECEDGAEFPSTPGLPSVHISYDDGDDEWIDGDDLIVMVYADGDAEAIQNRQAAVEEALADKIKKKKKRPPRKPKVPKEAKSKAKAKAKKVDVPSKPLPHDVLKRIELNEGKIKNAIEELASTRDLVRSHYRRLYDVAAAKQQQIVSETSTKDTEDIDNCDTNNIDHSAPSSSAESCFDETTVQHIIALFVHDSTEPLPSIVSSLATKIQGMLSPGTNAPLVAKYCEPFALTEYIKSIATRTMYGYRSPMEIKEKSLFEDESPSALWRWEVMNISDITTQIQPNSTPLSLGEMDEVDKEIKEELRVEFRTSEALKTIKNDYQRAGRVIKAVQRVVMELRKAGSNVNISASQRAKCLLDGSSTLDSASEVTIAGLEDRVTKSIMDVQKASERRQLLERKWETSLEEKEKKERKRMEEAERKRMMQQKKEELQQAQQQLKLSKKVAAEEARQAKAALSAFKQDSKRKIQEECDGETSKKKVKVLSEKEVKEQAQLAKQKNMMSSLFRSVPASTAKKCEIDSAQVTSNEERSCEKESDQSNLTESVATPSISSEALNEVFSPEHPNNNVDSHTIDLTDSKESTTDVIQSKALPTRRPQCMTVAEKLIQAAKSARQFDIEQFEHSIAPSTEISMGEISRHYRLRFSDNERHVKKKLRKPVKLSITVDVEQQPVFVPGEGFRGPTAFQMAMGEGGQCGGGYSEQKEVEVDSRKRLFSFYEDLRPPYFGTFSKKSLEVTGRRPFAKDLMNKIDYDVDSEAEWEEEEEGEDIIMSEDEDDGEGNEIVYDEFFCHDDEVMYADQRGGDVNPTDGGDDKDSVNAIFKAMQTQGRQVGERDVKSFIAGVRFNSTTDSDECSVQLSKYSAVVDPCSYWSPLPSEMNDEGQQISPEMDRLSAHPVMTLSTPSMVAGKKDIKSDCRRKMEKLEKEYFRQFQQELIPCLVAFIHGKKGGIDKMVDGFQGLWARDCDQTCKNDEGRSLVLPPDSFPVPPSKAQTKSKIKEITTVCNKRWIIKQDILDMCPKEVQESLAAAHISPEKDKTSVLNNKVISFPVVPAAVALESMCNVPLVTSNNAKSSSSRTRNNDQDKGQASVLKFFGKNRNNENEIVVVDDDVYEESQRGVKWWGESKEIEVIDDSKSE